MVDSNQRDNDIYNGEYAERDLEMSDRNDRKDELRSVPQYKKPVVWLILLVLVLCIAATGCLPSDPKTDGEQDGSGKIMITEADVDGDGEQETLSYRELGNENDGLFYRLQITKADGTELWPEEDALTASHIGWAAYFLCQDTDGYAILEYSPWAGQGLAAYS